MSLLSKVAKVALGVEEHNIPQLLEYRLSHCAKCSQFNQKNRVCKICGCFMDVKATFTTNRNPQKNRVEITHCPAGLWGDAHIANMYRKMDGIQPLKYVS